MASETYQLTGDAAALYEEQKVAAIFAPLARATIDVVPISAEDAVLDVACGTGIVARMVHDRVKPIAPIACVDLNAGMIEQARWLSREHADAFEWHVADVTRMPFADGTFSLAICQQGIQFFPDAAAALSEIRRVLRERSLLAVSVWAGASDFFKALADALARHVDGDVARRSLAPFSYDATEQLPQTLECARFRNVQFRTITVDRVLSAPARSIPKEILSNPIGAAVAERGEAVMQAIAGDVIASCARYRRGADIVVPQQAHLVTAVAA